MTKYEFQIYNLVNESRNHMTAEQVFDQLKESSPSVSLATVYNNLNKLCSAELIPQNILGGPAGQIRPHGQTRPSYMQGMRQAFRRTV